MDRSDDSHGRIEELDPESEVEEIEGGPRNNLVHPPNPGNQELQRRQRHEIVPPVPAAPRNRGNEVEDLQRLRLGNEDIGGSNPRQRGEIHPHDDDDIDMEVLLGRLHSHDNLLTEIQRLRIEDDRRFHRGLQMELDSQDPAEWPIPDMPVYDEALNEFFQVPDPDEEPYPQERMSGEFAHLRVEDDRGFRDGRHAGLGYQDVADLPVPDIPVYQAQEAPYFNIPDDDELADHWQDQENRWPQSPQSLARSSLLSDDPVEQWPDQENRWPQSPERDPRRDSLSPEFTVWEDNPWPQSPQGDGGRTVQVLRLGDDGEEEELEYEQNDGENNYAWPQQLEGAQALEDEEDRVLQVLHYEEGVEELADFFVIPDEDEEEEEPDYPDRPYCDLEVEPVINNDRPYNMSRDTELLWGPHIEGGVPTFRSFRERENWITQMQASEWAHNIARWGQQFTAQLQAREEHFAQLPPTQEEQAIIDRDRADLLEQMEYGSSTESALSPRRSSTSSSGSAWRTDRPGELYPRRTFQPYDRPTRPAEWTPSGRTFGREEGQDLRFLVMIGEIDPDFECYRGNIWIIHPANIRRGRQFPTGFIQVVQSEADFRRVRVMHGDLILKLGAFLDATGDLVARPAARVVWVPMSAATLHAFVDLTTRTHVDPSAYETIPGKYLGSLFTINGDETDRPLSVNHLAAQSTVREQPVGTICTALFRPQRGDVIILPQAWEDNFNHQRNFRRSMIKWYKGPETSDEYITEGTMVVRYCVDREFRFEGYRRMTQNDDPQRLLPLTYPSDPDYNWGFVELFMRTGTDWLFLGRDRLRPTAHISRTIHRCIYYCSNA